MTPQRPTPPGRYRSMKLSDHPLAVPASTAATPLGDGEILDLFLRAKRGDAFTAEDVLRLIATIAADRIATDDAADPFAPFLRGMGVLGRRR